MGLRKQPLVETRYNLFQLMYKSYGGQATRISTAYPALLAMANARKSKRPVPRYNFLQGKKPLGMHRLREFSQVSFSYR